MCRSVLLVTIDCLRVDHVGLMGYERPATPNLDLLGKEGVIFANAFASGPRTAESFPGILASTYPLMFGGGYALTESHVSVAEVLEREGYATAAFHSNPYLSTNYGYDRGFGIFWDSLEKVSPVSRVGNAFGARLKKETLLYRLLRRLGALWSMRRRGAPFVRAEVVNEKVFAWLDSATDSFFLWLHYMDPHYPYLPPGRYLRLFRDRPISKHRLQKLLVKMTEAPGSLTEPERQLLIDLYDAEVRYADDQIGHLMRWLQSRGLYDDLLIVVTADHGEEFREHGGFAHATWASEVRDSRATVKLYDELVHVPLLIRFPQQVFAGARVEELVSLLDVAPTVVDWVGAEPPERWQGQSLMPVVNGDSEGRPYVVSEYLVHNRGFRGPVVSCRTKEWKYIHEGVFGRHELYDLTGDPGELHNVIGARPDQAAMLSATVEQHIEVLEQTGVSAEDVDLDEQTIERLRGLGYVA